MNKRNLKYLSIAIILIGVFAFWRLNVIKNKEELSSNPVAYESNDSTEKCINQQVDFISYLEYYNDEYAKGKITEQAYKAAMHSLEQMAEYWNCNIEEIKIPIFDCVKY